MNIDRHLNFLFTTFEGGGSVGPALTVVKKLAARGHRVRVMSDYCNRFESQVAGARFVPWSRAPSRRDRSRESDVLRDWEAASPQDGLLRTVQRIMVGPALAYAQDVMEELQREPADLVVSNEMLFGVAAGCEAAQQKLVMLTANVSLFPLPGVPPLGPGLTPAVTEEDRALHAAVAEGTQHLLDSELPALNAARAVLELEPLGTVIDQQRWATATLMGTSQTFDFPAERLPESVRYVGPQLDEPAWVQSFQAPWAAGDPRPLILVAFSTSFQDHVGVLQRTIDAMTGLPVRAVVTLGDTISATELSGPENIHLVHSASHGAIMREAKVVVTHGGHGTVMRALLHRLPMLIIPHGRDQNDNAVRVTQRGAGLSLSASASTVEIRAALSRLLSEPSFPASAATLGEAVALDVAQSPIVRELEGLAGQCPQPFAATVPLPVEA
jgi:MGT family glycosyltransferase